MSKRARSWMRNGIIALALCSSVLTGCESTPRAVVVDRTQGMTFEFFWTSAAESRSLRAKLSTTGEYFFAGGAAATFEDFDWSVNLSDEQITALRAKIDASGLCQLSGDRFGEGECRIDFTYRAPGDSCEVRGSGETAAIVDLRAYLVTLSMSRFADTMDALPKGNAPR
ncbi:MAG: hypothetical protein EXS10_08435 [Phycisphaerales bacterium]|nr:hypothetical protein [Phycisphaerales bacterium]